MNLKRPLSRQPIPENAAMVFKGKLFDVFQWDQPLFDGSTAVFEKLKRPDTAYVIPVTPEKKLILSKQEQPGSAPYIGLIGGRLNPEEEPEQAAIRELREEAGIISTSLTLWHSYQFLPKIDWAIYTFVAHDCIINSDTDFDAGENVSLIYVDFDELFEIIKSHKFGDVEVALNLFRIANNPQKMVEARRLFGIG